MVFGLVHDWSGCGLIALNGRTACVRVGEQTLTSAYEARAMLSGLRKGHEQRQAWVEVDMVMPDGNKPTFMVAPNFGRVYSMLEVVRIAKENPKSHSARYHFHGTREDVPVHP